MVGALDFRSSDPGLTPEREHCVLFLGKAFFVSFVLEHSQWLSPLRCRNGSCQGLTSHLRGSRNSLRGGGRGGGVTYLS